MIRSFTKKPVVVQAVPWNGNNWDELVAFVGGAVYMIAPTDLGKSMGITEQEVYIRTLDRQRQGIRAWKLQVGNKIRSFKKAYEYIPKKT